jgi:hypothetical protein
MLATARLCIDRRYLARKYDEWLRYVSRWRRFEIHVAFALLCVGVLLVVLFSESTPYPWVVLLIGAVDVVVSVTHRQRWLRRMGSSYGDGTQVTIKFGEDSVYIEQEDARAEMSWSHFSSYRNTPHGLFLGRKGSSIFVPDECLLPSQAKPEIVRRLEQAHAARSGSRRAHRR